VTADELLIVLRPISIEGEAQWARQADQARGLRGLLTARTLPAVAAACDRCLVGAMAHDGNEQGRASAALAIRVKVETPA
jgi:hypothetical protein